MCSIGSPCGKSSASGPKMLLFLGSIVLRKVTFRKQATRLTWMAIADDCPGRDANGTNDKDDDDDDDDADADGYGGISIMFAASFDCVI